MAPFVHTEFFETGRGRIIEVLRHGAATVDDIAAELNVTGNAVRAHLATLERDGLVRAAGTRPGATRPSRLYELTHQLELLLSRAYIPLLTELVHVLAERESPARFDAMIRDAGRGLARQFSARFPRASLPARIDAASELLNHELGASTKVAKANGGYVIRGRGCPLAALTGKHPGLCHAIESFIAELLRVPVHECCDRAERPKCCFEISSARRGRHSKRTVRSVQ
jgi:predicted ArsR family transcriptional regulator